MSMKQFVENVGRRLLSFRSRGAEPKAIWVSEEGERVINAALVNERSEDVEFIPHLTIHKVPVCIHKRMPAGHVWYELKGGKIEPTGVPPRLDAKVSRR